MQGLQHAENADGWPLTQPPTVVIDILARHLKGALPIIGVGGIMRGGCRRETPVVGASLVQVYTGFIYSGPDMKECVEYSRRMKPKPSPAARAGARRAA